MTNWDNTRFCLRVTEYGHADEIRAEVYCWLSMVALYLRTKRVLNQIATTIKRKNAAPLK